MAMNNFEKICKRLNDAKRCGCCESGSDNKYICAHNAVKNYIMNDSNKLLELKGELKSSDFWAGLSIMIAFLSAILSGFTLLYAILSQSISDSKIMNSYGYILLVVPVFFLLYILRILIKYEGTSKWGGYVQVAIEEIEREIREPVDEK